MQKRKDGPWDYTTWCTGDIEYQDPLSIAATRSARRILRVVRDALPAHNPKSAFAFSQASLQSHLFVKEARQQRSSNLDTVLSRQRRKLIDVDRLHASVAPISFPGRSSVPAPDCILVLPRMATHLVA